MHPAVITRELILKHLTQALPEESRARNKKAMEKLAEAITVDVGNVILPLVAQLYEESTGLAPKGCKIKTLAEK